MFNKRDEKLVEQALKGNKSVVYAYIIRNRYVPIRYSNDRDSQDAADLMREIFISVFRSLACFKGGGKSWLIVPLNRNENHSDIDTERHTPY